MKTKYPSRATIKKLSRAEVEERLQAMGITLPVIELAPTFVDDYDPFLTELTEDEWKAQQIQEQAQRELAVKEAATREHPGAREALFQACVRGAVKRAGAGELNKIIEANLRDKENVPEGCTYVTHWMQRKATRLEKEKWVLEFLTKKQEESQ